MNRFEQPKKIYTVYLSDGSDFKVEALSTRKALELVQRKLPNGVEIDDIEEDTSSGSNYIMRD